MHMQQSEDVRMCARRSLLEWKEGKRRKGARERNQGKEGGLQRGRSQRRWRSIDKRSSAKMSKLALFSILAHRRIFPFPTFFLVALWRSAGDEFPPFPFAYV